MVREIKLSGKGELQSSLREKVQFCKFFHENDFKWSYGGKNIAELSTLALDDFSKVFSN